MSSGRSAGLWRGLADFNDLGNNPDTVYGENTLELFLSRTHTWSSGGGGGPYTTYLNASGDTGGVVPTANFFGATFESVVPEPGTLALFGLGMAGLAVARRRRA